MCDKTKKQGVHYDQIKILICSYKDLYSLKGIEKLINLEELYCNGNNLTSLEGIENLINLEYLYFSRNNLTDLNGIENLINLKYLSCSNNDFSNEYKQYLKRYCQKKNIYLRT
jgi:Leucine-rich repeat (LRR) protein